MVDYEKALRELEIEIRLTDIQWQALLNLCEDIRKEAVDVSYQDGYDEGYDRGKSDGYCEGHEIGRGEGYQSGYRKGHDEGHEEAISRIEMNTSLPTQTKRDVINRLRW